jgi:DNA polymerase III delta prime subunit
VEINASVQRTMSELEHIIVASVSNTRCRIPAAIGISARSQRGSTKTLGSAGATSTAVDGSFDTHATAPSANRSEERLMAAKCLIIDEMDGITSNVVQLLLQQDVHRPVICLANNLYAPALRELRAATRIILNVPPVNQQRLVSRLETIVRSEGCDVPRSSLNELAHISNGDIRCCLNTLQFLCRLGSDAAGRPAGRHAVADLLDRIKLKDATLGLWPQWNDMFLRKERSKYPAHLRQGRDGGGGGPPMGDPAYLHTLAQMQYCAEPETLLEGAFQFYPLQRYADYTFRNTLLMTDAFSHYDTMTTACFSTASLGTSMATVEHGTSLFLAAAVTLRCSSFSKPVGITFPRDAKEGRDRRYARHSALKAFTEGVEPMLLPFYAIDAAAIDVAALFVRTLTPQFKLPLHFNGISSLGMDDQPRLQRLAERLGRYGVSFREAAQAEGETGGISSAWRPGGFQRGGFNRGGGGGFGSFNRGGGGSGGFQGGRGRGGTTPHTISGPDAPFGAPTGAPPTRWVMEPDLEQFTSPHFTGAGLAKTSAQVIGPGGVFMDAKAAREKTAAAAAESGTSQTKWRPSKMPPNLRAVLVAEIAGDRIRRKAPRPSNADSSMTPPARRHRTEDPTGDTPSSSSAAKVAPPPPPPPPATPKRAVPPAKLVVAKKDFFGRTIVAATPSTAIVAANADDDATMPSAAVGTSPAKPSARADARTAAMASATKYRVKYVYSDGATNAIKRDATIKDFV